MAKDVLGKKKKEEEEIGTRGLGKNYRRTLLRIDQFVLPFRGR